MNENFSTPYWLAQVEQIENQIGYGELSEDFLHNPLLMNNMVANDPNPNWGNSQLEFVVQRFGPSIIDTLNNDPTFGGPPFREFVGASGHKVFAPLNSIHHLYHLARFDAHLDALGQAKSVVEWGGGFGNLGRLYVGLYPDTNYSMIDLPFMSDLQRRYLEAVMGPANGIETISVSDLSDDTNIETDLFISTWALSECTKDAQEYVGRMDFFGASSVLIAHQKSSDLFESAEDVESLCRNAGFECVIEEFSFTGRGDQYVFGRR